MAKYKRRIYLINQRFQVRFSFYVCSWLVALSFTYLLVISTVFDYFIRYLATDPMGPAIAGVLKIRSQLLWSLVAMQTTLVILTFIVSIFMSHKIAGPLYRLRKFLQEGASGNLIPNLKFRKGDYFPELAEDYTSMMNRIVNQFKDYEEAIQQTIPKLEKIRNHSTKEIKDDLEAALTTLRKIEKISTLP